MREMLRRVEMPQPEDSRRAVAALLHLWTHPRPVPDLTRTAPRVTLLNATLPP